MWTPNRPYIRSLKVIFIQSTLDDLIVSFRNILKFRRHRNKIIQDEIGQAKHMALFFQMDVSGRAYSELFYYFWRSVDFAEYVILIISERTGNSARLASGIHLKTRCQLPSASDPPFTKWILRHSGDFQKTYSTANHFEFRIEWRCNITFYIEFSCNFQIEF